MKQFYQSLRYATYIIFHPFDGFYEVKFRAKGNAYVASLFMAVYAIIAVIEYQFKGFYINTNNLKNMNSIMIILYSLVPLILFILGNFSITDLFDGKGRLVEIYNVVGYSLLPLILIKCGCLIMSNYIIAEEVTIYHMILTIGRVWFYFLVFCGLIVIHEYSLVKNITTLLVTAVAIAVIAFISLLFISLFQEIIGFFTMFFKELMLRKEGWS